MTCQTVNQSVRVVTQTIRIPPPGVGVAINTDEAIYGDLGCTHSSRSSRLSMEGTRST